MRGKIWKKYQTIGRTENELSTKFQLLNPKNGFECMGVGNPTPIHSNFYFRFRSWNSVRSLVSTQINLLRYFQIFPTNTCRVTKCGRAGPQRMRGKIWENTRKSHAWGGGYIFSFIKNGSTQTEKTRFRTVLGPVFDRFGPDFAVFHGFLMFFWCFFLISRSVLKRFGWNWIWRTVPPRGLSLIFFRFFRASVEALRDQLSEVFSKNPKSPKCMGFAVFSTQIDLVFWRFSHTLT